MSPRICSYFCRVRKLLLITPACSFKAADIREYKICLLRYTFPVNMSFMGSRESWKRKVSLVWLFLILPLSGANNVFLNTSGDDSWETVANWSLTRLPDASDNVIVNNGNTAILSVNSGLVDSFAVGNNAFPETTLITDADVSVNYLRVGRAAGAMGTLHQTGGLFKVNTQIRNASDETGVGFGVHLISGGTLDFTGKDMLIGQGNPGRFEVMGSQVAGITGRDIDLGEKGTLAFTLDRLGVAPIVLSRNFMVDSAAKLEIDGSDYEALDGYIPLISYSSKSGSFSVANITFIGLSGRFPALVEKPSGLWLRLTAPASYSGNLLTGIPTSTVNSDTAGSTFSLSRDLDLSGSLWGSPSEEEEVMDTVLSSQSSSPNESWELRVGRGGQIYSLRTPELGETVPPQTSSSNSSPWVDEVWQAVAVDTALNDPDSDSHYFIHQAGVYLRDPSLESAFYSPQVASRLDLAGRSFTTVHWGQHAHIDNFTDATTANDWQSHVLYITRVKDLGKGLIEVSQGYYNYGTDLPRFFNCPWGGVRRTSLEYVFNSNPDGTWNPAYIPDQWGQNTIYPYSDTAGWCAYSGTSTGTTPSMALIFGQDPNPRLPLQYSRSIFRHGYAGGQGSYQSNEAGWRNYLVSSCIRRYNMSQGEGFWSRYYFQLGADMGELESRISARGLNNSVEMSAMEFDPCRTPLIGYKTSGSGAGFAIEAVSSGGDFYLYGNPIRGSFPLYEIIENTGVKYLSWNPYATGVVKTYDGTIAGIRLLGFARKVSAETTSALEHTELSALLISSPTNYISGGELIAGRQGGLDQYLMTHYGTSNVINVPAWSVLDSDEDGLPNLLEYALNGDPHSPCLTSLEIVGRGVEFTRNKNALEVDLKIMASVNLNNWQSVSIRSGLEGAWSENVNYTITEDAAGKVTVNPVTPSDVNFYKLEATLR